jgi:hypothetical protein
MFRGDYADGYAAGFECELTRSLSIFDMNIGYGYGRSILEREGIEYPSTYDPGSKATCSVRCRFSEGFSISIAGDCIQGQRVTPLEGREMTEIGYVPVWGSPNSDRLPLNWGLSFGTMIRPTKNFNISLFVTDIPGRRFAVVYDDWHKKNFVKTHWYGGLKVGYEL